MNPGLSPDFESELGLSSIVIEVGPWVESGRTPVDRRLDFRFNPGISGIRVNLG